METDVLVGRKQRCKRPVYALVPGTDGDIWWKLWELHLGKTLLWRGCIQGIHNRAQSQYLIMGYGLLAKPNIKYLDACLGKLWDWCDLKEQSRPSVSKVTSADVSLTTPLNSATSLVNVMKSV